MYKRHFKSVKERNEVPIWRQNKAISFYNKIHSRKIRNFNVRNVNKKLYKIFGNIKVVKARNHKPNKWSWLSKNVFLKIYIGLKKSATNKFN